MRPAWARAGSWKQRDLPPPVGIRTKTSFLFKRSEIIECWSGLNSS